MPRYLALIALSLTLTVSLCAAADAPVDPYAKEGNIPPRIVKLTPQEEQKYLSDVKVADGFEATLFAPPQAGNYPVFVAAAPDGTLYVSSDGNGSLGRNPHRGRILRLRDTDNDGRADEVKQFVKDVDSPRGLVWDHDRLYLVHPPHLSAFIDKDGDGVSDEEKVLVKNIAFGFDKRPADHTTNGLSLGIDGWLYIAGGDFGFIDAEGTDGRKLTHRGGGVIRVRPDGTGLEIYSTGTRNILEVAISPLMDIFARDNTNDGGGWNVRFHHFTGLDDHGYPRLFKNFPDECVAPLADYGGGSGCGAVYIDEPGFGQWNNAPFTCDWGTGALWHHQLKPKGATFEETRKPEPFVKLTRPTDADVDAMSRVYVASWKGATFNWEGPEVGYIVCVRPEGWKVGSTGVPPVSGVPGILPGKSGQDARSTDDGQNAHPTFAVAPLPDFAKATDEALVKLLVSPSYRRKLEALRELMRRGSKAGDSFLANSQRSAWPKERLAAQTVFETKSAEPVIEAMKSEDAALRHMGIRKAGALRLIAPCLEQLSGANCTAALRALALMHQPEVVDGLIERLPKATDTYLRRGILAALCRLHYQEGEWKGDSWGTRPDTRGPYYQPEAWSETPRIAAVLKETLAKASPEEAAFLVKEMNRNRIQSNDALDRILQLAKADPKVIPDAVAQLAEAETIPAGAVGLLVAAVSNLGLQSANVPEGGLKPGSTLSGATISQAIVALTKTDSAEGVSATLAALVPLQKMKDAGKEFETARDTFLNSAKLENHHQLIEGIAEKLDGQTSLFADVALLNLANRKSGSPEARELSAKALDNGWKEPKRRKQIVDAIASIRHQPSSARILAALNDADPAVKDAAERAAKAMKLQKAEDKTPKIETLKFEEAVAAVLKTKGDVALGEQLFVRQTCNTCHTVRQDEPQKGPYLGNIAQTYKRPELAQNILDPNKTIAQGFASEVITMKNGVQQMGFITLESADSVKLRNVASQEFTFATKDIQNRQKLPISIMPPGLVNSLTVHEFASLLDYLEALAK